MKPLLDLYKLSLFLTVAETKSFTRTAEKFLLHQSSISLHIASLEKSLDVTLFDRKGRQATLTEAGQLLRPFAQRLLQESDTAIEALEAFKGVIRGQLHIGASTTPGAWLLPRWLGQFQERYPNVAIDLEIGNSEQVLNWLLDGKVAVAVVGFEPDALLFVTTPIITDEIVLTVGNGHPWICEAFVTLDMVNAARLICRETGSATRRVAEEQLGQHCCQIRPSLELGSTTAIKQAVMANLGAAFLPKMTLKAELAAGDLSIVPVVGVTIQRSFYIVQSRQRWQSPAANAFCETLLSREGG